MSRGLGRIGFVARARGDDGYVQRLGRLRWERRFPGRPSAVLSGDSPASSEFRGDENWIVVRDEAALPLAGPDVPSIAGQVLVASLRSPAAPPPVHTLRELEHEVFAPDAGRTPQPEETPALAWRVSDFPPRGNERVADYIARLLSADTPRGFPPGFAAVVFDEVAGRGVPADERSDVTVHLPLATRRLLDVGCGAGGASAALRRERAGLEVTGIEKDPTLAALARARLDRLLESDATTALAGLVDAGERFDGFLLADVLEHLDDPIGALRLVRELATPGATLVASVPNAGHLSLVRDLLLGRFDPLPAGLADAGHLRWFTRVSLEEALEEGGWRPVAIEPLSGAPAPEAAEFLRWASEWPESDSESLATYQWVAVATAGTRDTGHGTGEETS